MLALFAVIIYSCDNSSPVNTSDDGQVINGTIRGIWNYPMQYKTVYINDKAYTTNELGKFTTEKTKLPYDVYYEYTTGGNGILYKDVNQSSIGLNTLQNSTEGLINYQIVVHCPTLPPEYGGKLFFIDENTDISGNQTFPYSTDINVNAPPNVNVSGSIYFITYTYFNNHIGSYKYFARKQTGTLNPGINEITITPEELDTLSNTTINCSITPPSGNTLLNANFMINFNSGRLIYGYSNYLLFEDFVTSNFSLVLPANLPAEICVPKLTVHTNGSSGNMSQVFSIDKNTTTINMINQPTVISPANYAMNVDSNTVFSFQKQAGSNVLIFTLIDSTGSKTSKLCTSENNITMKMLSRMIKLQPNRTYSYYIEQAGPEYSTVGDYLYNYRTGSTCFGITSKRYFTAKP